jgi:hypothetical protein
MQVCCRLREPVTYLKQTALRTRARSTGSMPGTLGEPQQRWTLVQVGFQFKKSWMRVHRHRVLEQMLLKPLSTRGGWRKRLGRGFGSYENGCVVPPCVSLIPCIACLARIPPLLPSYPPSQASGILGSRPLSPPRPPHCTHIPFPPYSAEALCLLGCLLFLLFTSCEFETVRMFCESTVGCFHATVFLFLSER